MDKEKEERLIMDIFRDRFAGFPKGNLTKTESPDFVLRTGPKRAIGIEVTALFRPNSQQMIKGAVSLKVLKGAITDAITRKEGKLGAYRRRKLNQLWLLLTMDSANAEMGAWLSGCVGQWEIDSGFRKIYLIDWYDKQIWELK
jgi:hypothetical protein